MRSKSILFVFMMSTVMYSFSQSNKISIQSGITGTAFSSTSGQKIKIGDTYYLGYEYETGNKWLFSAGLEYATMGSTTESTIGSNSGIATFINTIDFKYVSIPLKVGKKIGDDWFGFGYLGISNGFLVKATSDAPVFDSNFEIVGRHNENLIQRAKRYDFAGLVDLGFGKKFSNHEVFLSCSFTFSATSFSTDTFFIGSNPRNYGGMLKLGYNYRF